MKPTRLALTSRNVDLQRPRPSVWLVALLGIVISTVVLAGMGAIGGEAATAPPLGPSASYSVLAGSIVTNTGPTTISGNLGISPSIGVPPHYTGFPPGAVGPPGVIHDADANAAAAQADNTAAFTFIDQGCNVTYAGVQDLTLVSPLGPGVYCAGAFLLTGNLTLSGSSGVWIFKSAATLTTASNSSVTGGDPCNVWWRIVSSATLGTGTSFIGNVLALTSIGLQTGATLNGRAMAQTGAVTLDSNTITGPNCAGAVATATQIAAATATQVAAATATQIAAATATQVAAATATQIAAATATAIARGPVVLPPLIPQGVQNPSAIGIFSPPPRAATPQPGALAPGAAASVPGVPPLSPVPVIAPPKTGEAGLKDVS